ncbi:hypothetical protein NQ318_001159 [Aromia moschata]|uniref:Uncharacterized protein n=1 Tax=Aromia moschata TaxID=1265417 RepID=A0AAV8ZGC1_9CUCU|nr:hypothetical protein NQ318_001159 [Aromia moschata]
MGRNRGFEGDKRFEVRQKGFKHPQEGFQSYTSRPAYNPSARVYDRFKWLCGCPKRNKLFCFICLVTGGNQSAWTQEGCVGKGRHKATALCARHKATVLIVKI